MDNVALNNQELLNAVFFILLAFLSMFVILIVFFYFSRKKIVQIEVEKKDIEIEMQKKILINTIETQEEERKRIAQDLHDDISSKLNVVSLNTHLLKTPNLTVSELDEITENIIKLTKNALENSRKIAHDLLPPVFEKFGLHAGIEELVFEFNSSKKTKVIYANTIDNELLENLCVSKQLHIFRILQELLNNTFKHANAKLVTINFLMKDENICLIYEDDGVGFSTQQSKSSGIGLSNIDSRISILNGKSTIYSKPGNGFHFQLEFNYGES